MKPVLCAAMLAIFGILHSVNAECHLPQPRCGEFEEYICKNISCVSTCQNPNRNGVCDGCSYGCYCKDDYYWRNENTGKCVEMSRCPCKKPLVFRYSNPCQNNCLSEICPQYVIAGCFCPHAQCEKNGTCIPEPRF